MSNLYYQNLGITNAEDTEHRVRARLRDFHDFFENTEFQMKKRILKFTSRVEGGVWAIRTKIPNGTNPFTQEKYYSDAEGKQPVVPQIIDTKREQFVIKESLTDSAIYIEVKGNLIPIHLEFKGYLLADIHPKGVREDDEDGPLGILNAADEVRIEIGGLMKTIKFSSRLEKDNAILLYTQISPTKSTFELSSNTHVISRLKKALEMLALSPQPHQLPLLNLFRKHHRDFEWPEGEEVTVERWFVLKEESREGTNEQREFVKKCLSTKDFAILEGPPGSGKTTTLLEFVAQAAVRRKRILIVASTHVAIDNLMERLISELVETEKGMVPLKEACGIFPLRIGDEGDVLSPVKPFCLDNFVSTEISRIRETITPIVSAGDATKAQEAWLGAINNKSSKKDFSTILVESANLICGTTIGILKAPLIQKARQGSPLFDYIIIDEASKTTFPELLVPALYGTKWIISGDIKQLSPYADREPILDNLRLLPSFSVQRSESEQKICLEAFNAVSRHFKNHRWLGTSLFLCKTSEEAELAFTYVQQQAEAMNQICRRSDGMYREIAPVCCINLPESERQKLALISANFVVTVDKNLKKIEPYLPPDLLISKRQAEDLLSPAYPRRMNFGNYEYAEDKKWDEEILWRICRMHELKGVPEQYEKLCRDIEMLVPRWDFENHGKRTSGGEFSVDAIHRIRRIALPSVIELLVEGFEIGKTNGFREDGLALYEGLNYSKKEPGILNSRRVLLTYQHRMHPDISRFSREMIYDGEALRDASGMKESRKWGYGDHYSSAAVWFDCRPRKNEIGFGKSRFNLEEVRRMKEQLESFISWARAHPNPKQPDGSWSVACLTFYKGQVREIIEALHPLSGNKVKMPYFIRKKDNVSVRIGTVDRFQGQEADLVLLSFVQSGVPGRKGYKRKLGFLNFPNRVNVAITRARYQLVIFGDNRNFKGCRVPLLDMLANECTPGDMDIRER